MVKSRSYLLLLQKNAYQTYIDALTNPVTSEMRETLFKIQEMDESARYLQSAIEEGSLNIEDRITFCMKQSGI